MPSLYNLSRVIKKNSSSNQKYKDFAPSVVFAGQGIWCFNKQILSLPSNFY